MTSDRDLVARWLPACMLVLALSPTTRAFTDDRGSPWPRRVLITNDNGIDDPKLVALARAFAPVAETWVLAPAQNCSGSSHRLAVSQAGRLEAVRRDLGAGIRAWAVDGYPADCVALAVFGLMRDTPPDLVVSGINGGPNLAHDWLWSGTIGAARMAAFARVRAVAISGLDDDMPGSVAAAIRWVVALARSPSVRRLDPGDYLTVSLPRVPPAAIKGVRLARRADRTVDVAFQAATGDVGEGVWTLALTPRSLRSAPGTDAALYADGYVVVVPMRADEHDDPALARRAEIESQLPAWPEGQAHEPETR
jgi:5'-nucleotidase